jgi:chromosome segregation protein
MYLTSLKLAGFKSFVDPTQVTIRSNMTAIVGPNGCGKSNIVDAIRWVIGESSAKQLRGQSMSDVIFNGTSGRKPVGKAIVELHFDNSAGRIVGEYAKYTDLVIRREVERDGQSNYYLNGSACRRRDILDVFLGTGLGPRSYSIIEQGMISQLIEAKPEELRAHFEEVAGVSKYKERRRETQTRIEHTKDNLDRLNDIRQELEKQLRHLKRQANAAEQYKVLKEEERSLSAQLKALQWQALAAKRQAHQEKLTEALLTREQQIAEQRGLEAELDKLKLEQETIEQDQQGVQKSFYQLGEEIARLEQQIKHHQEQQARWERELAEATAMWEELTENASEERAQLDDISLALNQLTPLQSGAHESLTAAQTALTQANQNMQAWQQQWDKCQHSFNQLNSQQQVTKTKIENHEQQKLQLAERRKSVEARLAQLNVDALNAEIPSLQAALSEAEAALQAAEQELRIGAEAIQAQRAANKQEQQALNTQLQGIQRLEAEYAKLNALQQAALSAHDQHSAAWLKQRGLDQAPKLGQKLHVESGWEHAVETVLSGQMDAVCVKGFEEYAESLAGLQEGRITLVDQSSTTALVSTVNFIPLLNKVSSEWALDHLQGIYVADTLADALAGRAQLAAHESIITRQGVWLGANWLRVSQIKAATRGTLEREKALAQLMEDIKQAKILRQSGEEALKLAEQTLVSMEQSRDSQQENYKRLSANLSQARTNLATKTSQIQSVKGEEQRLQQELAELTRRAEQITLDMNALLERREQAQHELQVCQTERQQLDGERPARQSALETARSGLQEEKQRADELSIRISANESQLGLLRQSLQRSDKQLNQLTERRQFLIQNLAQAGSPTDNLQEQLQVKLTERLNVEQALKTVEARLGQIRHRMRELNQGREQVLKALEALQGHLEALRMQDQEAAVRQQTIVEQLTEAENSLEAVLASLIEGQDHELEPRLQTVQSKINRLGPINLAAIDEFQSGSERKDYLDKQFQDLNESLETLEAAIRKIDRESRARFRETYEKVNQGFQAIFPRIFGGGKAYLELSDEDLLTTGIIVRAQPPGKKNATIHLLSGGEKALTAISLIFAMFQLNPAPFCILDEVDAPLDDLNVGRFCAIVKEMSKETQFFIISHNKVTIETADHLMGVTMQEPGVSRLVAVDVAEALEMVESA